LSASDDALAGFDKDGSDKTLAALVAADYLAGIIGVPAVSPHLLGHRKKSRNAAQGKRELATSAVPRVRPRRHL